MKQQGLLIIDGAKNCVLLTKEDLDSYKTVSELIAEKVRNSDLKQHKRQDALFDTVRDYLKGNFEPNYTRE